MAASNSIKASSGTDGGEGQVEGSQVNVPSCSGTTYAPLADMDEVVDGTTILSLNLIGLAQSPFVKDNHERSRTSLSVNARI
jgi:hypothetical protein